MIFRILFARFWRWLTWSKENRELLNQHLNRLDKDLENLERIIKDGS